MSFADFCAKWKEADGKPSQDYLKDLHLYKTFPGDEFYTVPDLFEDDWLNEYWPQQKEQDDYRFAYFGGHTTFTPLHADVYRSYSWSSNICGIKKWTLFPPGQEDLLKDKHGNSVYDLRDVDPTQFTKFEQTEKIEIYQKDGETVFVPSNWFHQVENIGAAISINHNWINAMANRIKEPNVPKHQPDLIWQMERIEEVLKQWETDEPQLSEYFISNGLLNTYSQLISNMDIIKQIHRASSSKKDAN
ncbi:hypothetical protein [Parasitella parasitica]|uniref:JmjC domain-containing protein n=1 Tax=Parasitella parasitica TaxID=35722 RepID=A0A0B7MYV5_9FUNG|nr:hypothetical protein [Parasitella parasitica]